MRRKHLFPVLGFLLFCAITEAAIPLNSLQTFDTLPDPSNWATRTNGGGTVTFTNAAMMDAAVQTNDISTLTNVLPVTGSDGTSQSARWHYNARNILTRPGGIGYISLLATLQNTSGKDLSSVIVAYDFGSPYPLTASEDFDLNGWQAYYSLTGQPFSWTLIPELSTGETGSLAAVIAPGMWPQNSLLYILWVDDNGSRGGDGSFTIDNFVVLESFPPPPPPRIDPPGANVVEHQTIRLTAFASGYGLTYQWLKDGMAIPPATNPTAVQPILVITNARTSDAGQYSVVIASVSGGATADPVTVVVLEDLTPPSFVRAWEDPYDLHQFHAIVSEELCNDLVACQADFAPHWVIRDLTVPGESPGYPESVQLVRTNLTFRVRGPRIPGRRYAIVLDPDSLVTDLEGNRMPGNSVVMVDRSALFQQGINTYAGTQDAEIHSANLADSVLGAAQTITADLDNVGIAQGLLRFENMFGFGPGQISPGSRIVSASLTLAQLDPGDPVSLHRMLADWNQGTVTWNSMVNGVSADNIEALAVSEALTPREVPNGFITLDVTAGVRAWADGQANYGWILLSTSGAGSTYASSESAQPPSLAIVYDSIVVDRCDFTIQPSVSNLTFREESPFTLGVNINSTGLCLLSFQWMKDGTNIPGASSSFYTVNHAGPCDTGTYRVRVTNLDHSVTSNPVVLTMSPEVIVPQLTRAFSSAAGTNITLRFSRPVERTRAENPSNYILDPPVEIAGASLLADDQTVVLTTGQRDPLVSYRLQVQNLVALLLSCGGGTGNLIQPNPARVSLTGVRVDVPWASEWLYSTNNQDDTLSTPAPWSASNFSPGADWFIGRALFGTETSAGTVAQFPTPLLTPILPNTNTPPDQITTYFRKQIELEPLPPGATYALCQFLDDGAVFYLDGVEIVRVNITNAPPVLFAHRASANVEASVQCFLFVAAPGLHTLAVEVHQAGPTSTDILFGAQVEALAETPQLDIGTSQPLLSWNADSFWELLTSTNVLGPFAPVALNSSLPLGAYSGPPTHPAAFFRLRYKGTVK